MLRNGNFTIYNSQFISNTASEGGGAIHVDQGDSTMSMLVYDSIFQSNSAFTGGVFDFEFMNSVDVTLVNNSYTNNTASFGTKRILACLNLTNFRGRNWICE